MKLVFKRLLIIAFLFSASFTANAQLDVTQHSTALELAQRLVGEGVSISNVTFTGNATMAGFFLNRGGTQIGIDSGIVLTNGTAKTTPSFLGINGSNSITPATRDCGLFGDADLTAQIGGATTDACILQFDFVPLGDSIKFRYVFSSEEYDPEYVCFFNDAFGFFITGPGITGTKNIALVPNTTTPVSIRNVNNIPAGCVNNPQYYIDNPLGAPFFRHDGMTTVLTALERVQPCQTYTLKLVIADAGADSEFDSGVFLEARSLSSNAIGMTNLTQTDPASGLSYIVEGCVTGAFNIRRPRKDPFPLVVNLSYGGTVSNGIDLMALPTSVTIPANDSFVTVNINPLIDGVPEGIEELRVYALAGCAAGTPTDSTIIQLRDYDILDLTPDTAYICKNSSLQLTASGGYTTYQWEADPTLSSSIIRDPVATPTNPATTYICTATIGTCNAKDSVFLRWRDMEFISKKDVNCRNGATGQIKVAGGPEWPQPVEFSLDGITWQPDSTFNNIPVGNYWVKIRNAGCIDSVPVNVIQAFPDLSISSLATTPASCSGAPDGTITINGAGGNSSYTYSIDGVNFQTSNVFNVPGSSPTVTIKDGNGCLATQNVSIPLNNTVTVDAGLPKTICEGTSVVLDAVSNGTSFQWSSPVGLDDPIMLNPRANPVVDTRYYLTATTGICSRIDSIDVFVRPAPIPDAGSDFNICYGKNFTLNASGGVSFEWTPTTNFVSPSTSASQNPEVRANGDITYSLMVTDIFNCRSLVPDIVKVDVTPSVRIFAGNDTVASVGQPIRLHVREMSNAGVTSYNWTPGFPMPDPTDQSPVVTLNADQRFLVVGTTPDGCKGIDDILVKVYKGPEIYVPTAFTPNNDGLNDFLEPVPVGIKEFKFFTVYNRWGQMIFTTRDPKRGWNGKLSGVDQPTGTFVWMAEAIDYRGNLVKRKGVVTIIR